MRKYRKDFWATVRGERAIVLIVAVACAIGVLAVLFMATYAKMTENP